MSRALYSLLTWGCQSSCSPAWLPSLVQGAFHRYHGPESLRMPARKIERQQPTHRTAHEDGLLECQHIGQRER